jgi:hypothetical protein
METLTAEALAGLHTIITGFMQETTENFKTFAELVAIFARDEQALARDGDGSNDLCVLPYEADMRAGEWQGPIILLRHESGLVGDGIHRGIAYLRCIEDGINPTRLPPVLLDAPGSWPPTPAWTA